MTTEYSRSLWIFGRFYIIYPKSIRKRYIFRPRRSLGGLRLAERLWALAPYALYFSRYRESRVNVNLQTLETPILAFLAYVYEIAPEHGAHPEPG